MIIDFLPHDGPAHHHHHHHHHGHGASRSHAAAAANHDHDHDHGDADDDGQDVHKAANTVTHHGFSEESIKEIFVAAGVGKDFAIDNMGEVTMGAHMGKRTLFMARGTKA